MAVQNGAAAPEGGKARRIYLLLRDEILGGTHAPGQALPGELRLADAHGVSRVTIRRALDALVGDGLVERRAGSGTVVRRPSGTPVQLKADFATLMPQLQRYAEESTARLLSFAYVTAPPMVGEALNLRPGDRVQRAVRLRLANDKAFSHLTTFVPESIAQSYSEADLASTPLFRLLERRGLQVDHARQTVSAVLATPETADPLETTVGAALIALTRVVYDSDGAGIEYLSALYRPDRFQLEMTLNRVGESDDRHWEPVFGEATQRAAQ
ncbi:GntR family transcriptional regulator [Salipiger sp.]|uniref:GntR family transcriptional regulator n=1 Tax=Salipiger sp. TaxID=2078585 RepID=UPI003A96CB2A